MKWQEKHANPGWVTVYIAGDLATIERACREYCFEFGLCVTVTPTKYIYTGGEELGVAIGLINYPRFPKTAEELMLVATEVGLACAEAAQQMSFSVVSPLGVCWHTRHPKNKPPKKG